MTDSTVAPWVAIFELLPPLMTGPLSVTAGCGGALVAPDRVVTAARCLDGVDPDKQLVHINARVLSRDPGEVRRIRGIAVLPGFEVLLSPAVPDDENDDHPASMRCRNPGNRGRALGVCGATPSGEAHGCFLDSGSPGVVEHDGHPELAGAFSFGGETAGKSCAEPQSDALADVAAYRDWVLGPLSNRGPFPFGATVVSRIGDTLWCMAPLCDPIRGQVPDSVTFSWVDTTRVGPYLVQTPIPGANSAALQLTPVLRERHTACVVDARNAGGHTTSLSAEN